MRRSRRKLLMAILTMAVLGAGIRNASAQAAANDNARFLYGVSLGPEHRATAGTMRPATLPAGSAQPTFGTTATTLTVEGGVLATDRVAFTAFWDQTFGSSGGPGKWGTTTLHATGRAWLTHSVWVEAGGGLSGLAHRTTVQAGRNVTQFWAPGISASAGVEVIRGPHVSVNVFARYSTATFNGLTIRRFSIQAGLLGRE